MTRAVLSDWEQFRVALAAQVQSYFRTYRFWVIFGIVVLIGGGISIALTIKGAGWVQTSFGMTATNYTGGVIGFMPILAIVAAAFFGGDAISADFGSKTGYFMLALPIRRSVLLSGRYAAAFLTSVFSFAVFYLFAIYGGLAFYSFGSVPWWSLGLSFLLGALMIAGFLSFAFCLSSTSRSPAIGFVVTFLVLLVAFQIASGLIVGFLPGYQFFLIYPFASKNVANVITGPSSAFVFWQAVSIMAIWAASFFAIALTLYHREET
ncbi:MAG: ABC transporter permease [Thermoplasmata archaeon]